MAQAVLEIQHQTTTYSDPSYFQQDSIKHREGCSNIDRKALGIKHGSENFHHYYFTREVSITTDHKQLMSIFKKDMAILSKGYNESSSEYTNTESE